MSQRQRIIKDFKELQPIDKRLEILAANIYQIVWRGEAERAFEPKAKTQIHRVWKMMKLDLRQQRAWIAFRNDVEMAAGQSGRVTGSYGEFEEKTSTDKHVIPIAYTNKPYQRVEYIFEHYLGRRERALLWDLLRDDLQSNGELRLEMIGLIRSGYKDQDSARAAGVVHIQTLLDRLADLYQF